MRPSARRNQTGIGSALSSVRPARVSRTSWRCWSRILARSRLRPATSRRRRMARPPAARPSASMWPPAAVLSSRLNGRPSANRASRPFFSSCAEAASSQRPNFRSSASLRQAGDAGQGVRHHAHAVALLPEHQHLRLGLDDGFGRQQVPAQLGHLLGGAGLASLRPRSAASAMAAASAAAPAATLRSRRCAAAAGQRQRAAVGDGHHQRRDHDEARQQEHSQLPARPDRAAVSVCLPHLRRSCRPVRDPAYAKPLPPARRPALRVNESLTIMWRLATPGQSVGSTP